ncbi:MAG TPA: hypothetical protein VG520_02380 [Candidatus Dormibacteraeota bacterium]|nr:hypothetical protein [Candidatus Dormibacteraeota bacterium]
MPARSAAPRSVRVCVEATAKRAFASALDWPGWCRSGKDEHAAVDAMLDHMERYRVVARAAAVPFAAGELSVVERLPGSATTDFGAPGTAAAAESEPLTGAEARRLISLVAAAWTVFDDVVAATPASLRKGPRGGGRDRDAMAEHVLAAEHAYARKLGVRLKQPRLGDAGGTMAAREAILEALRSGRSGEALVDRGWLPRYAARRIAWHVLDHAWEMEDRSDR